MNTIKNIIVFIALWVFSYFVVETIIGRRYTDDAMLYSLAMAILIAYVWNRLINGIDRK